MNGNRESSVSDSKFPHGATTTFYNSVAVQNTIDTFLLNRTAHCIYQLHCTKQFLLALQFQSSHRWANCILFHLRHQHYYLLRPTCRILIAAGEVSSFPRACQIQGLSSYLQDIQWSGPRTPGKSCKTLEMVKNSAPLVQ